MFFFFFSPKRTRRDGRSLSRVGGYLSLSLSLETREGVVAWAAPRALVTVWEGLRSHRRESRVDRRGPRDFGARRTGEHRLWRVREMQRVQRIWRRPVLPLAPASNSTSSRNRKRWASSRVCVRELRSWLSIPSEYADFEIPRNVYARAFDSISALPTRRATFAKTGASRYSFLISAFSGRFQ